ncbi:MAG: LacI family DNA-binding transcriptional regulator [Firmicutes bacterium]|nr:LacI family DNA-binding transcriptional regulator [Bacillota bacterium]
MATMKDVAKRAGVSVSTVSHVLSETKYVSPRLRESVLKAMRELNYQRNQIARSLKRNRSEVIGLIVPDLTTPFFTSIVDGAERVVDANSYSLILGNSRGLHAKELQYLTVFAERCVEGLLVTSCGGITSNRVIELRSSGIPVVLIDQFLPDCEADSVLTDSREAIIKGIGYLAALGHRRIATISGPVERGFFTSKERLEAYLEGLRRYGLEEDSNLILNGGFSKPGGKRAMKQLIGSDNLPTAVFIANGLMTIGAIEALEEAGLSVPGDISILGFDDIHDWFPGMRTSITTFRQPSFEMGAQAADLLFRRIRGESKDAPPRSVRLPVKFIVRDSCAPPRERTLEVRAGT